MSDMKNQWHEIFNDNFRLTNKKKRRKLRIKTKKNKIFEYFKVID